MMMYEVIYVATCAIAFGVIFIYDERCPKPIEEEKQWILLIIAAFWPLLILASLGTLVAGKIIPDHGKGAHDDD
jgi:hypothetical protein